VQLEGRGNREAGELGRVEKREGSLNREGKKK